MTAVNVLLPIRLESTANKREHWGAKYRRTATHKLAALAIPAVPLPCIVTITRIGPRDLDAHDNLPHACKGLVDGIADRLGVKDNDPRVTWRYAQQRGKRKEYAARVCIEPID